MTNLMLNLNVLKERFSHVAHKIAEVETSITEGTSTYIERVEPDHEWLQAVRQSVESTECIFVYGFAQGLAIADLLDIYPDRLLYVYEPDIIQFYKTLMNYDLRDLLNHRNLHYIAIGEEQLNSVFYMAAVHMQQTLAFVALRYYLEREMDVLREIKSKFEKFQVTYQSNLKTHQFFKEDWVRNGLYQIADMLSSISIESLKNVFPNSTAVVVASGPSLKADIDWINRLYPHALILSAGSSIQALVKHGIQPHIAVTLDGGPINGKVFLDPKSLEAPLLYASTSYYEITDRKINNKIHAVMSNDEISQYFMGIEKAETALSPTPTVTGTAIQAAVWMGARRVILMGQDLSFPGGQFYTDGVEHADEEKIASLVENAPHKVLNVQGSYNQASDSFIFMKDSLENLFEALPGIEFINSTRYGVSLEGTIWKPIEQVYELVRHNEFVLDQVTGLFNGRSWANADLIYPVREKIITTMNDLDVMKDELSVLEKKMNTIREMSRNKPAKCQQLIAEIEKAWADIVYREWFSAIYEIVLPLEIAHFDQHQPLIAIEQNLIRKADLIHKHLGTLIKQIESKIPMLKSVFEESIRRIDAINL
ncbi:6-hydroxymethylpterin diphosphokinase MptE-like protein [Paenibacillus sp. FSL W7-1088]|uniref:motility associated factor glycosyltransferase family protein n=1 Tax=Paenibacillus sp. FSL W7-1088 TaxID=2921695 RepID=UPI0030EB8E0D